MRVVKFHKAKVGQTLYVSPTLDPHVVVRENKILGTKIVKRETPTLSVKAYAEAEFNSKEFLEDEEEGE